MSREDKSPGATQLGCPDELARELDGAQDAGAGSAEALWQLLGAAALPPLAGEALEGALARTRAAMAADASCPSELCELLEQSEARDELIDPQTLWRVLGESEIEPPSAQALERTRAAVMAQVAADLEAEAGAGAGADAGVGVSAAAGEPRRKTRWWQLAIPHFAVALGFIALAALFKKMPFSADWPLAVGLGVGAAVLATFVVPYARLVLVSVGAVSALAMLVVGHGSGGIGMAAKCGVMEMVAALVPLAITATMLWRRRIQSSAATLAAATASGALAGQAALILACPGRNLEHLLVGHVGGVLLAAGIGFVVGLLPVFRGARANA
ncbi:MAG: hypothetical protein KC503_21235 [Myxococcales bacterium]|nr:hypothetical protein [Myxococcales bacterium]